MHRAKMVEKSSCKSWEGDWGAQDLTYLDKDVLLEGTVFVWTGVSPSFPTIAPCLLASADCLSLQREIGNFARWA